MGKALLGLAAILFTGVALVTMVLCSALVASVYVAVVAYAGMLMVWSGIDAGIPVEAWWDIVILVGSALLFVDVILLHPRGLCIFRPLVFYTGPGLSALVGGIFVAIAVFGARNPYPYPYPRMAVGLSVGMFFIGIVWATVGVLEAMTECSLVDVDEVQTAR